MDFGKTPSACFRSAKRPRSSSSSSLTAPDIHRRALAQVQDGRPRGCLVRQSQDACAQMPPCSCHQRRRRWPCRHQGLSATMLECLGCHPSEYSDHISCRPCQGCRPQNLAMQQEAYSETWSALPATSSARSLPEGVRSSNCARGSCCCAPPHIAAPSEEGVAMHVRKKSPGSSCAASVTSGIHRNLDLQSPSLCGGCFPSWSFPARNSKLCGITLALG
mmetsp:Transcript_25445/g.66610  ORF Transcript_25445/g.66610 Transcript_25445/m.66610 type:complete len:219 (+) Transcript_25445:1254-1910(+)